MHDFISEHRQVTAETLYAEVDAAGVRGSAKTVVRALIETAEANRLSQSTEFIEAYSVLAIRNHLAAILKE